MNLGKDTEADRRRVLAAGGRIVEDEVDLAFLVVQFDVDSLDALMAVRDGLRAEGTDAELALWSSDPTAG